MTGVLARAETADRRPGVNWERLARLIVGRRVELGFGTREAFAQTSKISSRLLSDLENARRPSYAPSTVAKLEQALQWTPGSVDSVLAGRQPQPSCGIEGPAKPRAAAVASNIRAWRAARRWSADDLAALATAAGASLSRQAISQIEAGARGITVDELFAFAEVFSRSVDTLATPSTCDRCGGGPPEGFACPACGMGNPS